MERSIIVGRKGMPIILFRKIIDEAEDAAQEEVAIIVSKIYCEPSVLVWNSYHDSSCIIISFSFSYPIHALSPI